MAEVTPGAQQKASNLALARNRRKPTSESASQIAGKLGAAALSPQQAAVQAISNKVAPQISKALGFDKKWMRLVWRILLWTLPLSAPIILLLILLLMIMVVLG